jgi:hypothetical protein
VADLATLAIAVAFGVTDSDATGTHSANVGATGRAGVPTTRSHGDIPILANSSRAASHSA